LNAPAFYISPYDLVFLGTIFIGLTFVMLLGFTKRINRTANRFLAMALLTIVLQMVWVLGIDVRLGSHFPRWNWLPLQFSLALGPLIYFYVLKITRPEHTLCWKDTLHFSPVLLQQGVFILEVTERIKTGTANYDTLIFRQLGPILQLLIAISVITYLYFSHRLIERFYKRMKFNDVSDRYRYQLRWLHRLLAGFGMLWLLWIPFTAADCFYFHFQLSLHAYYPLYLLLAAMMIWIAAVAFLRPEFVVPGRGPLVSKPLPSGELKQKAIWLKKTMEANLFYRDAELSLGSLAETLEMHPHDLSRIVNVALKKNFSDFVNEYRIREVSRKMLDPAYDRITLLGIAFDSGFNSKTTFNRAFRQMIGKSPAEFKNDVKKERPFYFLEPYSPSAAIILRQEATPKWSHEKLNRNFMFKNYLKIAWRGLVKNKAQSFLNISGLSVGLAVAVLIGLWIADELAFNRNYKNYDAVAQIARKEVTKGDAYIAENNNHMPIPLANELRASYGNYFKRVALISDMQDHIISFNNKPFSRKGMYVEPDFTGIFSLEMVEGTSRDFTDPDAVLINESTSKSLFGNDDPIGKIIKLDNKQGLKVTGVFKDLPYSAKFSELNFVCSWSLLAGSDKNVQNNLGNWNSSSFEIFVQANPDVSTAKISQIIRNVYWSKTDHKQAGPNDITTLFLFPMKDWHLHSGWKNGVQTGGRIETVWMFGIIGIFVLLLACINFMNLSTARSEKRAKEVGIRKTLGSLRSQLIKQFLSESFLAVAVSFAAGIGIVLLSLNWFNQVADKRISFPFFNPVFWIISLLFILITALLAGSYPALYLSSFQPVKVLKGTFRKGNTGARLRQSMVILQFTFSIMLIIGTIVVYRQIQYAQNRPVGYNKNGLIQVQMNTPDLNGKYDVLQRELLNSGGATGFAQSSSDATQNNYFDGNFDWEGQDKSSTQFSFALTAVTVDFGKTVGWQFTAGRDFSKSFSTDQTGVILNETAVKNMRLKDPVGKTIKWTGHSTFTIIGVIKDMIIESPYKGVQQTLYFYVPNIGPIITIRLNPVLSPAQALGKIEPVFRSLNPSSPFDYRFVDEEYGQKFAAEQRVGKLSTIFAAFAIFISCLGIFGLASYVAEQRRKEIGVRKVLGASVASVWTLLSTEFVILVVIAFIIAMPLAYYFMHRWLQGYEYHTNISWWIFAVAGFGALGITVLTVSYQTISAALMNPVKSLRSE